MLWEQIVARKAEWIGGTLVDEGDGSDRAPGEPPARTTITDMVLTENQFSVKGEDWSCSGHLEVLGIQGTMIAPEPGAIVFYGYGGHTWYIVPPVKVEA